MQSVGGSILSTKFPQPILDAILHGNCLKMGKETIQSRIRGQAAVPARGLVSQAALHDWRIIQKDADEAPMESNAYVQDR